MFCFKLIFENLEGKEELINYPSTVSCLQASQFAPPSLCPLEALESLTLALKSDSG